MRGNPTEKCHLVSKSVYFQNSYLTSYSTFSRGFFLFCLYPAELEVEPGYAYTKGCQPNNTALATWQQPLIQVCFDSIRAPI